MKYRVAGDYVAAYANDPLTASAGSTLEVERRDTEWPGWVWCTTVGGAAGWVPEAWLDSGRLRRDYTARELTVRAGDVVTAAFTESGWAWCTNPAGESGWVPVRHLVH